MEIDTSDGTLTDEDIETVLIRPDQRPGLALQDDADGTDADSDGTDSGGDDDGTDTDSDETDSGGDTDGTDSTA